ncbi:hypothetical protein [Nostoc sp.]
MSHQSLWSMGHWGLGIGEPARQQGVSPFPRLASWGMGRGALGKALDL